MAFTAETIFVTLEGGIVLPITNVTADYTTADIEIFDGSTYRDNPVELLAFSDTSNATSGDANIGGGLSLYAGSAKALINSGTPSATPADYAADPITHTAPRYWTKKRTLWSFPRASKATHVIWGDNIIGTSPVPPFRIGMTPTADPS